MAETQKTRRLTPQTVLLIVISVLNLLLAALLVKIYMDYRILVQDQAAAEPAPEQSAPDSGAEDPAESPAAMPVSEADIALYQAQCREIPFSELLRDADAMKRQYFTFAGEIIQAMDGRYRLQIVGSDVSDDVVYLDYTPPAGGERLLEDDCVRVWGQSEGLYTYTSVNDEQITVPRLRVCVLERLTEAELLALTQTHYDSLGVHEAQTDAENGVTYTLTDVCIRPAAADDSGAYDPDATCCIFLLFDIRNDGTEDFLVYPRGYQGYIDGYSTDLTFSLYDDPAGLDRLRSETLEPGYGVRGHLMLLAPNDWQTAELRISDSVRFQVRNEQ